MTEGKSFDQPQMSKPDIPKEEGVHSVAGKKQGKLLNMRFLYFGGAAALGLIALIAFISPDHAPKDLIKKEESKDQRLLTSNRTLTVPPLPNTIQAPKAPNPENHAKTNPLAFLEGLTGQSLGSPAQEAPTSPPTAPMTKPTSIEPLPQPTMLPSEPQKDEKKEPTLDERRFAAPMMGETDRNSSQRAEDSSPINESMPDNGGKLGSLLNSVSTPGVRAEKMPDRNMLLAKGTFIDCILETRLDTTVPGMTSCVIPRNIYSSNGKVLLLERGSKAIGEYRGAVENGLNRIFVLWTQVQTPQGIRMNLDSPATDALGGAGMSGEIDFHWWRRFGNALLFTLVQDGFEFGMTKQTENNGGVNYYQNSEDGMKEIIREAMRQSGNIPPTLTKNQGERIGIFVARDVDFSSVYQLKTINR